MLRNKIFSAINIVGLAVGLATCLLIVLFVLHELSYDRYHTHADRIYRMTTHGRIGGTDINAAGAGAPAASALVRDYTGVEAATRLNTDGSFIVKHGTDSFKEEHVAFVDSNFFTILSIPLATNYSGINPKTMLTEPNTVVLTQTTARKYFGDQNPVGQTLTMGDKGAFRVTGVCEDVPSNTHFHYDFFCSMRSIKQSGKWLNDAMHTYLLLREGYSVDQLRAKSTEMVARYIGPELPQFLGISLAEFLRKGDQLRFQFQPITDIHLHSDYEDELEPNSNVQYIYIFVAIAGFILLLACINFMNLSTAGSAGRAKEVGVRKVMGSERGQLMGQFLAESVLLTFLALLLALVLVAVLLPGFNQLAGKQFGIGAIVSGWMLPGIGLACLLIGLLAGSYPAFVLSAFRPVSVLKGRAVNIGARSGWLRNTLVTVQFVVSITMIVSTILVSRQLNYIQNKKVGFDKEQVLILNDTYTLASKLDAFKAEIAKLSPVVRVTSAGYMPAGSSNSGNNAFQPDNGSVQPETYRNRHYFVDEDYLPTLGIGLAQGRNFSKAFPSDSSAILINEAAARQFGWKNPIGQRLKTAGDGSGEIQRLYTIVGVVRDFHFESMRQRVAPLVLFRGQDNYQMALRVKTDDMPALLKTIEQRWKAQTDMPFTYSFLSERFSLMYASEQRVGQLFGIFAGLAVLIACLGLFGLAAFTTRQRTKEIGVRKVLGASVASIITLLSKDFLKLVLIAIVIASPIAWYAMNRWLQDFAYKIDIEWWVFALAGFLAVGIALLTVSFQSIKAALMNPVRSLRSE
ncbi:ABC transporter permease [Spirosoma sp. 209]|uniref:ABC transporter permease n=1 Tax=Spirosoma TaxID=107 RepID=UPI0035114EC9